MREFERQKPNSDAVRTSCGRGPAGVRVWTVVAVPGLLACAAILCLVVNAAAIPSSHPMSLDQELAHDYQNALVRQGVRISSLVIVDDRAHGGIRRAEIIYRTTTTGTLAALRPEIVRLLGPSANPRLALDQTFFFPTKNGTAALGRIIVVVPDYERWLRNQMTDDEFYGRWTVRGIR